MKLAILTIVTILGLTVASPQKSRTCTVQTHGNGVDDADNILSAFHECQQDSTIIFKEGVTYNVQRILDLKNLTNVDVEMRGTIEFGVDLRYWFTHSMYQEFQNVSIAMRIGGDNIIWDGFNTGLINGNGEIYYENFGKVSQYWGRPVPFYLHKATNSLFRNFKIFKSQYWSFVIDHSENIVVDNINIENTSNMLGTTGNTDGFDTLYSNNITILNSIVNNGDDSYLSSLIPLISMHRISLAITRVVSPLVLLVSILGSTILRRTSRFATSNCIMLEVALTSRPGCHIKLVYHQTEAAMALA
jgi:hypothetical protein